MICSTSFSSSPTPQRSIRPSRAMRTCCTSVLACMTWAQVTPSALAAPVWVDRWLDRGAGLTRSNFLGGLADTVRSEGKNWCETCELFASHTSGLTTLPRDNSGSRFAPSSYWSACADPGARLQDWLGPPPEASLSINAPDCTPCTPHFTSPAGDPIGACVACGAGEIAYQNACEVCRHSSTRDPSSNRCLCGLHQVNESHGNCDLCASNSIAAGDVCDVGRRGSTANATSETCDCLAQQV